MKETPVLEFETDDCLPPEDHSPATRPGIQTLIEAIRAHTQLVPGLLCPHPEFPGKNLILDGVGRWYSCGKLGIPFRAILLASAVSEAERITLKLQHNLIRRSMSQDEVADDAQRFMTLMQCTQEEAAQRLALSSSTISRALAVKRKIPQELKLMADVVRPSVASLIATLPNVEVMRQALEYATTPGKGGKLPTREQVVFYLEQFKKKKAKAPRPKTLKGTIDGRKVELGLLPNESTESVIKFLQSLATKLGEYRKMPPDSLGFLFNG